MKKSKIALKPYLETIAGYCSTLSNEELTDILICLARDVPTTGRVNFLEKMESYLPGRRSAVMPEASPVEQILDDIQALKESIEERIRSIEDGSYWDDPDFWGDDGYYEEDPDYISEDQVEELGSFFDDVESLFLDDRLEDARKVYMALFNLIDDIKKETFSTNDGMGTSFYDEIIKGLKQKNDTKSQAAESLSWAEKIGKIRIDHIVSNKHRRAYERAAQVLGSLAEAYLAMGQKNKTVKILHNYSEKYKRFSAFRSEVKAVVKDSDILRNSGF